MSEQDSINCPSHRCKTGSKLLAVRQDDGTMAILPEALPIDQNFIDAVKANSVPPEQRFRFTNKCIENGCKQWTDKGCGVVEQVVKYLDRVPLAEVLPPCSIRAHCRWFLQKKADACRMCPYVLTEITEAELAHIDETSID